MATVTIEYYGVHGSGRNVTEAKRDAGRKLERLTRDCSPRIYAHRGYTLVAWSTADGASYSISHPDSVGGVIGCSCCADRRDAEISGVKHLLTMARTEGDFAIPSWAATVIGAEEVKSLAGDWARNDRFQARYREARARGMDDCASHSYACQWN